MIRHPSWPDIAGARTVGITVPPRQPTQYQLRLGGITIARRPARAHPRCGGDHRQWRPRCG